MAPPRPDDNRLFELTFQLIVRAHVSLYRLTGGRIGSRSFNVPVLLLTTKGRKSGKPRTIPLLYLEEGDAHVLVASYAGLDRDPAWYANLQANPHARIQVRDRVLPVRADTADTAVRATLWPKLVVLYPDYQVYQTRTQRVIPVVVLTPLPGTQ